MAAGSGAAPWFGLLVRRGGKQACDRLEASPTWPAHIDLAQILDGKRWLDDNPDALPAAPGIEVIRNPRSRVPDHAITDSERYSHPRAPLVAERSAKLPGPPV
jgi:hypothetical protein